MANVRESPARPATGRPTIPGTGRLGLVDPGARASLTQLGWDTPGHVELLWSLSRAPDADAALKAMVRLAESLGPDFDELAAALLADRGLRGRLFGVLGSSLALGDHLVAHPQSWKLLAGSVRLPSADELREQLLGVLREVVAAQGRVTSDRSAPSTL